MLFGYEKLILKLLKLKENSLVQEKQSSKCSFSKTLKMNSDFGIECHITVFFFAFLKAT